MADNVTVDATESLTVDADALAASVAVAAGIGGASLAISAAIAENTSESTVLATISNSEVTSKSGFVLVDANSTTTLTTKPSAVSVAVTAAIGIAAAGAGAVARNTSSSSITAKIDQGSTVTANQALTVQATDTSEAHADLLSLAISGGLLGLSIGIGIAQNDIENSVLASVLDSSATAGGANDLEITASATQDIEAKADVVSISISLGGAGAGAVTRTNIDSNVEAYARNANLTATGNKILVDADSSHIARANSFGTAAAGGVGVSVVVADASIGGATRAYVDGASQITATAMDVTADSITRALPDGLSIAAAFGIAGNGVIISGAVDRVTEAYVGDRAQQQRDVVEAVSNSIYIGNVALATGDVVTYDSGAGDDIDGLVSGTRYLVINDGDGTIRLAEFEVDASSGENIYQRDVFLGSQGTGTNHTLTRVGGPALVFNFNPQAVVNLANANPATAPTTVTLTGGTLTIKANADHKVDASPVSVGIAGGVALNVSVMEATIAAQTLAYVGERATVNAGDLDIDAISKEDVDAVNVTVGLAAGASVGISIASATIDSQTEAFTGARAGQAPKVGGAVMITLTDTATSNGIADIYAQGDTNARAESDGGSAAFGVAANVFIPTAENSAGIFAYVGEGTTVDADDLKIEARTAPLTQMTAEAKSTAGAISAVASVNALFATAIVTGQVEAFVGAQEARVSSATASPVLIIDGSELADGDVDVIADASMYAKSELFGVSGSFGLNVSVVRPTAEIQGVTRAYVRDGVDITSDRLKVQAGSSDADRVDYLTESTTFTLGFAGIANISVADAAAITGGIIEAFIGAPVGRAVGGSNGSVIDVAETPTINAWSDLDANALLSDVGVSLAVNVADLTTNANVTGTTRAFFGQGGDLDAPGLTIVADGDYDAVADTNVIKISGLVGVSVLTSYATVSGIVDAHVGAGANTVASNDIGTVDVGTGTLAITANGRMKALPDLFSFGLAGAVSVSAITVGSTIDGAVRSYIGEGMDVDAGTINITATAPEMEAKVDMVSVNVAGAAAIDDVTATATSKGVVEAYIGANAADSAANVTTDVDVGTTGTITILADALMKADADVDGGGFGGLLALSLYDVTAIVSGRVSSYVRDGVDLDAGTLNVKAGADGTDRVQMVAEANSTAGNVSFVAAQDIAPTASVTGIVEAFLGAPAEIDAGGPAGANITVTNSPLNVLAYSDIDATAGVEGGSGSLAVSVNIYKPTANAGGTTRAFAGDGTDVSAGTLKLFADGDARADADLFALSLSGFVAVSALRPMANVINNVEAYIGRGLDEATSDQADDHPLGCGRHRRHRPQRRRGDRHRRRNLGCRERQRHERGGDACRRDARLYRQADDAGRDHRGPQGRGSLGPGQGGYHRRCRRWPRRGRRTRAHCNREPGDRGAGRRKFPGDADGQLHRHRADRDRPAAGRCLAFGRLGRRPRLGQRDEDHRCRRRRGRERRRHQRRPRHRRLHPVTFFDAGRDRQRCRDLGDHDQARRQVEHHRQVPGLGRQRRGPRCGTLTTINANSGHDTEATDRRPVHCDGDERCGDAAGQRHHDGEPGVEHRWRRGGGRRSTTATIKTVVSSDTTVAIGGGGTRDGTER